MKTGQFDHSGRRVAAVKSQRLLLGFNNNDTSSYTITMWSKSGFKKDFILREEIILPGSVGVYLIYGGQYGIRIRKGAGYFFEDTIIVWDAGEIPVNKRVVDAKLDLKEYYHKLTGGREVDFKL